MEKDGGTSGPERYAVIASRLSTGEGLPLLVRAGSWKPASLALRWVVLDRRDWVQEATLRGDLDGLRYLYAWADDRLPGGLESRLEAGGLLTPAELQDFAAQLRSGGRIEKRGTPVPSTVGRRALAALTFLKWAAVPASRNSSAAAPYGAADYTAMLDHVLQPLAKHAGEGRKRITPLSDDLQVKIEELIAPRVRPSGQWVRPVTFHRDNPFRPSIRLRVWLMWVLGRDAGLRLGELLTLRVGKCFAHVDSEYCVVVGRAPDSPDDLRAKRPQVKTSGRAVPAGLRAKAAASAYMTAPPPHGRRRGSPYLFTSTHSRALSISSASHVMSVLRATVGGDFSWHSLRHAWAEEIASYWLNQVGPGESSGQEQNGEPAKLWIMDKLRILGGWSDQSHMPAYYTQLALAAAARRDLAKLQHRRAQHITAQPEYEPLPFEDDL